MKFNNEDRIGVYTVAKIVTEDLNWIFRELPTSDYGIDGLIEIVNNSRLDQNIFHSKVSGRIIALQIKCGDNYFKEYHGEGYIFRGSLRHLDYWLNHSLPVIIVIVSKRLNLQLWQIVKEDKIVRQEKGFKILIPIENDLVSKSEQLKQLAYYKNEKELKLYRLQQSLLLIEKILKQDLYLYVELDYYLDNYQVTVIVSEEDFSDYFYFFYSPDLAPDYLDSMYYTFSDHTGFVKKLNEFFPWADIFFEDIPFTENALKSFIVNNKDNLYAFADVEILNYFEEIIARNEYLKLACVENPFLLKLKIKPNKLATALIDFFRYLNE